MNTRLLRSSGITAAIILLGITTAIYIPRPAKVRSELNQKLVVSAEVKSQPTNGWAPVRSDQSGSKAQIGTREQERTFTLNSATAQIIGAPAPLSSSDGLFDRAFVPASGITKIHVFLPHLLAGEEVAISAPNGGNLQRNNGALRFTPKTEGPVGLDLAFEPTMGRGAYTITIRQVGALAVLDFWAGPTNPIGDPGPAYIPTASNDNASIQ